VIRINMLETYVLWTTPTGLAWVEEISKRWRGPVVWMSGVVILHDDSPREKSAP
jgi:hypothetical protein